MIALAPEAVSEDVAAAEIVHQYAADVIAGRIVTNRLVRLACERHIRWLARTDIRWDAAKAGHGIRFFSFLRLHEGQFEGKPFVLSPWQAFIVGSIEGWHFQDPTDGEWIRMIRNAYVETAKGSGKTPLGAGITGYGMVEGKSGAQCYSAAAGRDQSKIPWNDFRLMVEKSPALRSRIRTWATSLTGPKGSSFGFVSSEARNLHGKRVYRALLEELHAHEGPEVTDAIRAGTKAWRDALILRITNSGFDRHSVCWADHQYSVNVLEGVIEDDHWFAFVCGLDMCEEHRASGAPVDGCEGCDQWTDEAMWEKPNPNLDVSLPRQYLREMVREAMGKPSQQSIVKRLNFCIWTEGSGKWLDVTRFMEGAGDGRLTPADLAGRKGWAGADLSSTTDLTGFTLKIPRESCETEGHDGRCYDLVARFWLPAENMAARVKRDHVPFDVWARDEWITLTEGNRVDQEAVARDVLAFGASILALGIDRWNTGWLTPKLQAEGVAVVEVGQGFASLSTPAKRLEADIAEGLVHHEGNPVLAWMVANAVAEEDASGNVKPSKAKSTDRIDGVAAWCDALYAEADAPGETAGRSIYEDESEGFFS